VASVPTDRSSMRGSSVSSHALESLAAQFDSLIAGAPLGIGIFDRDLRHVRVNPVLEEMNGRSAADLVGRTPAEVNGDVGREAEELYRQVMESGVPMRDVRLTGEVAARPGEVRHWSVTFHPVRQSDEVVGLCVIVADVTAEQELAVALAASERRNRALAEQLQRDLLPPSNPVLPGADVATVYRPATSASAVGGDFYDVVAIDDRRWLLVIGDVQGKGPLAASRTAAVRYAIRTAAVIDPDPMHVLRTVNEVLLRMDEDERLCTAACLLVEREPERWSMRSVTAGHPVPLLLRAEGGGVECVGSPGLLLGVQAELLLQESVTSLSAGDTALLYTDGVTEARAARDGDIELFGESRLRETLAATRGGDATTVAQAIDRAVRAFSGGVARDDVTLLALRVGSA
jgi:PAS domain S-box-containing protein